MGMSLATAEIISAWANWILLASLLIGGAATYFIFVTADIKETALKRDISENEVKVARANERAERSETARVAMLEQLKPRDLKVEQIDAFADALRGKFKAIYLAALGDSDAMQYMNGFAEAVRRSGAAPLLFLDKSKDASGRFWTAWDFPVPLNGVAVYANPDDERVIMEALAKVGVASASGIPAPNEQFKGVPTPTIFVGLKPTPFSKFPSYAAPPELRDWQKKHPPAWEGKE